MASLTIENYVKMIYQICNSGRETCASTGELATALNISPGSVTSMLKTLHETGLAKYKPYEGVQLTPSGETLALRVLRRHRLIELFLVKTLDLSWDEVHEEAENMEHAVSDLLVDRIDQYLGLPPTDPHGDPIPRPDGTLPNQSHSALSDSKVGTPLSVARMNDQDTDFLQFAEKHGLMIGAKIKILEHNKLADSLTIKTNDETIVLGLTAAANIEVCNA